MFKKLLFLAFALGSGSGLWAQNSSNLTTKIGACNYQVAKGLVEVVSVRKVSDAATSLTGYDEYQVMLNFETKEGELMPQNTPLSIDFMLEAGNGRYYIGPDYLARYQIRPGTKFAMKVLQLKKGKSCNNLILESAGLPNDLFELEPKLSEISAREAARAAQLEAEKQAEAERLRQEAEFQAAEAARLKAEEEARLAAEKAAAEEAERQRKAEEARLKAEEEARLAAEKAAAEEAERQRKAEAARIKAEIEAEKAAEAARLKAEAEAEKARKIAEEAARKAELQAERTRLEAERRAADEARKAQEIAENEARTKAKMEADVKRREETARAKEAQRAKELAERQSAPSSNPKPANNPAVAQPQSEGGLPLDQVAIDYPSCSYAPAIQGVVEIVSVKKMTDRADEFEVFFKFTPDGLANMSKADRKLWEKEFKFVLEPNMASKNPNAAYIRNNRVYKSSTYGAEVSLPLDGCSYLKLACPELPQQ
jgi:hypothetical protein